LTGGTSVASVAGAILVNAATLEGRYLPQGSAVAISRAARIQASLLGGVSGRHREWGEIAIARIECFGTQ
jgi:hypothetical protein